jgi:hypothetical protein
MLLAQQDLDHSKNWAGKWLLQINVDKCKMVSYGYHVPLENECSMKIKKCKKIEKIIVILDLDVIFDSKLKLDTFTQKQ